MTTTPDVRFDPVETSRSDDPYPLYAELRAVGRVVPTTIPATWAVTRHADVSALLRDPRISSHFPHHYVAFVNGEGPGTDLQGNLILNLDPPDHTRLRRLMSRAFAGLTVRKLTAHIGAAADALLDAALERVSFDVIDDVAFPLPFQVICELLALDVADRDEVRAHILDLTSGDNDRLHAAAEWTRLYMSDVLAAKAADPDGDLFQRMLAAEDDDDALTHQEIVDNAVLLFLAGFETTMNLIGNGTKALLDHPVQLRLLMDDPALAPLAVEEFLRYDSPVHSVGRIALEPIDLGDAVIEPMHVLMMLLGSANRDDAVFDGAAELDITRKPNPHMAFGGGVHHCLGAMLARLEGEVVFGRFARRLTTIEPDGDAERRYNNIRGFAHLPVRAEPR